jgi:DNA-binding IscR family transcriptional regulator
LLSKKLDGNLSILEIAEKKDAPLGNLRKVLTHLVEKKLITFHIEVG